MYKRQELEHARTHTQTHKHAVTVTQVIINTNPAHKVALLRPYRIAWVLYQGSVQFCMQGALRDRKIRHIISAIDVRLLMVLELLARSFGCAQSAGPLERKLRRDRRERNRFREKAERESPRAGRDPFYSRPNGLTAIATTQDFVSKLVPGIQAPPAPSKQAKVKAQTPHWPCPWRVWW